MAKVKRSELREQIADELAARRVVCADLRIAREDIARLRNAVQVAEDEAFDAGARAGAAEARVRNIYAAITARPDIAKARRLCREYLDG